jgi:hypothetical protein
MRTFFHSDDGRLRGFRVAACAYLLNAIITAIGDGWHSVDWVAWFLMAIGFFAISEVTEDPKREPHKWRSPTYLVGVITFVLGIGLIAYRIYRR